MAIEENAQGQPGFDPVAVKDAMRTHRQNMHEVCAWFSDDGRISQEDRRDIETQVRLLYNGLTLNSPDEVAQRLSHFIGFLGQQLGWQALQVVASEHGGSPATLVVPGPPYIDKSSGKEKGGDNVVNCMLDKNLLPIAIIDMTVGKKSAGDLGSARQERLGKMLPVVIVSLKGMMWRTASGEELETKDFILQDIWRRLREGRLNTLRSCLDKTYLPLLVADLQQRVSHGCVLTYNTLQNRKGLSSEMRADLLRKVALLDEVLGTGNLQARRCN